MKKLKRLNLPNAKILNVSQMKMIMGGYGQATCSASCGSTGTSVTLSCSGSCEAKDGVGVSCTEGGKVRTEKCPSI